MTAHKKKAAGPKFEVGDKVKVDGQAGEIVSVACHDDHHLASHEQLYGVRLAPWEKVVVQVPGTDGRMHDWVRYKHPKTGEFRDHEADTLAVPESSIEGK